MQHDDGRGWGRRDLPAVLAPPPPPVVVVLHALVHPEPTEAAALPLRQDVPVLRRAADATTLEEVESEGGVLTVRDRPEKRNLGEEPAPARRPEHGRQEAGLALAPDGRGEEREERHQRDTLGPEGRVRPVDQVLEVRRGRAEAEGPRRRLPVLARREDPAADAVDALPDPLQALTRDPVGGRDEEPTAVDEDRKSV